MLLEAYGGVPRSAALRFLGVRVGTRAGSRPPRMTLLTSLGGYWAPRQCWVCFPIRGKGKKRLVGTFV